MVLIVTEHFAISTSTSKTSPSELCNLMLGIWNKVRFFDYMFTYLAMRITHNQHKMLEQSK